MMTFSQHPGQGPLLLLAHGAGAPVDSPVMESLTATINRLGVDVWRFEFPFMVQRRHTGKRRPPDRPAVLLSAWNEHLAQARAQYPGRLLVVAGKSLGGRIASMLAQQETRLPWIAFGYPFHPPRKPDTLRTEHLYQQITPALIVQGTRDALGCQSEVAAYRLPEAIQLHWLSDGDHDFKPRQRSGFTQEQHLETAAQVAVQFIQQQAKTQ